MGSACASSQFHISRARLARKANFIRCSIPRVYCECSGGSGERNPKCLIPRTGGLESLVVRLSELNLFEKIVPLDLDHVGAQLHRRWRDDREPNRTVRLYD